MQISVSFAGSDFYPRSPCGERLHLFASSGVDFSISIHALLAESDNINSSVNTADQISIHALLAESDYILVNTFLAIFEFLSTLSLRRATFKPPIKTHRQKHFYPRSPCGERHNRRSRKQRHPNFYPRSPCGERRPMQRGQVYYINFYPRSPCGERHTSIAGRITSNDFYPRSPCGERRSNPRATMRTWKFLSTLSLRRATSVCSS